MSMRVVWEGKNVLQINGRQYLTILPEDLQPTQAELPRNVETRQSYVSPSSLITLDAAFFYREQSATLSIRCWGQRWLLALKDAFTNRKPAPRAQFNVAKTTAASWWKREREWWYGGVAKRHLPVGHQRKAEFIYTTGVWHWRAVVDDENHTLWGSRGCARTGGQEVLGLVQRQE